MTDFNPFTETGTGDYFVGRDEQVAQVRRDLRGARAGRAKHIYVAGKHGTGKTAFLEKIAALAGAEGFVVASPTVDQMTSAWEQLLAVMGRVVIEVEKALQGANGRPALWMDFEAKKDSNHFRSPGSDRLESDRMKDDFEYLLRLIADSNRPGLVLCLDEGQRLFGAALSALKNALQHVQNCLCVISLRVDDVRNGPVDAGRELLDGIVRRGGERDLGASAFFVTGIPMGPFKDGGEAANCIRRRLEGNVIQFDDYVTAAIGDIEDRVPRGMVGLAASVYDRAAERRHVTVGRGLMDEQFRTTYSALYQQAVDVSAGLPQHCRGPLLCLATADGPLSVDEILARSYPSLPGEVAPAVAAALTSDFARLEACGIGVFADDACRISPASLRYALRLALGD